MSPTARLQAAPAKDATLYTLQAGVAALAEDRRAEAVDLFDTALASIEINIGDAMLFGALMVFGIYSALMIKRPTTHPMSLIGTIDENKGADEGRGPIARPLQERREGLVTRVEREDDVA